MLIFGDIVINYSLFDVLMELLEEDEVFTVMNINPTEYTEKLIMNAIEDIFEDKALADFYQIQEHLHKILKLQKV